MTRSHEFADGIDATGVATGVVERGEEKADVRDARSVRIIAHGAPATQGSKKAFKRGKKIVLVEMDEKLPAWRSAVEAAARLATGPAWVTWDGPVSVSGVVNLRKPGVTKFRTAPAGPPDLDKLQRAIGDALTKSKVITDDARIVHWNIRKVWAENVPGADITISQEE
jgi:crossover junction endodeoxyribonuclease RusA